MRLTKTQIGVITALNIVIAVLVAVILIVPPIASRPSDADGKPSDDPNGVVDVEAPPVHDKYRAASQGLVDSIERETRLMGNGDETVVKTYFHDGKTYIFGNATVKGLDFDNYGGFLCVVDDDGKIESFAYFNDNITATCVMASGYGAAAGGKLYYCDYKGTAAERANAEAAVVGMLVTDGGVAAVAQPNSTMLIYTEYTVSDSEWTVWRSTQIDSGYSLKYFDCYDFGDRRVIAARAHSLPRYDSLALYAFEPGGDAAVLYYGGTGDNLIHPYAVRPYKDGYFALASKNGVATIISVEYSYMSYHEYSLGFTVDGARLFYDGKTYYYACFDRADGAVTYELDNNLSRRQVTELNGLALDCIVKVDGVTTAFGGVTEKNSAGVSRVGIAAITLGSGKTTALDITSGTVCGATDEKSPIIVLSARGGAALTAPTGTDVYIIKIK